MPPARFVELRRIERAQALLASTSLPVGTIAEATGFASQFYFAHRFRHVTGTTPFRLALPRPSVGAPWRVPVRASGGLGAAPDPRSIVMLDGNLFTSAS